ncbi:MAG: GSCFA domain-containing protein [Alphaproteobacteria bacterium]
MHNISARQAVRNMRNIGEYAQWSIGGPDADERGYESVTAQMAGGRVFSEFTPFITPKFHLGENPALFTSGSCFAREIEHALHAQGKTVLSWSPDCGLSPASFNRYNIFSVLNDFRLAQGGGYDEDLMWETPIGWIDYSGNDVLPTRDALVSARNASIKIHKQIAQADVFIVTLGLIETWYDLKTNTYLNFTPSEVLAGNLSRFECRITDYAENLEAAKYLIDYLRTHFNPNLKIIVTVSPVPLNVSFSGQDIAQANTLSKSTLRTVAQKLADEDENIDYFPSYEMVTLSNPTDAWLPDHRHVRREMVSRIMQTFVQHYIG